MTLISKKYMRTHPTTFKWAIIFLFSGRILNNQWKIIGKHRMNISVLSTLLFLNTSERISNNNNNNRELLQANVCSAYRGIFSMIRRG